MKKKKNWFVPICNENVSEHKHASTFMYRWDRERARAKPERKKNTNDDETWKNEDAENCKEKRTAMQYYYP